MKRVRRYLHILFFILIFLLGLSSLSFFQPSHFPKEVRKIDEVNLVGPGGRLPLKLPTTLKLQAGKKIFLETELSFEEGESLCIKSVYMPLKVYMDGKLIAEFGEGKDYPAFMEEMATEIKILPPPSCYSYHKKVKLVLEYLPAKHRKTSLIHPIYVGRKADLLRFLLLSKGASFVVSIFLWILGCFFLLVAGMIKLFIQKVGLFFYLGIFSILAGLWGFGESNLSVVLVGNYGLLYYLAFVSLSSLFLPLLAMLRGIVLPKHRKYLNLLYTLLLCLVILAMLLQLTGALPFYTTVFVFHLVCPLMILFLTSLLAYDSIRYRHLSSKRFFFPMLFLSTGTLWEVFNYTFHWSFSYVISFQSGLLCFIVASSIVSVLYLRDLLQQVKKEKELEFEMQLMQTQVEEQKKKHKLMLEHEEDLRKQRHDLKHHIAVLQSLALDQEKMLAYLEELNAQLPSTPENFCENIAIQSILSYYAGICKEKSIVLDAKLVLPEADKEISDSDLAIIFGNLLENATEASEGLVEGARIKLRSLLQYDILIIQMENPFHGKRRIREGRFYSTKREDFGIGLSSIQDIARKWDGDAEFSIEGQLFLSKIYLRIKK